MKKTKRKTPAALDDSTQVSAMIDIVFLLLIYFILTQKPIIEDTLLGFTPSARSNTASATVTGEFITIELTANSDSCRFNGSEISLRQLSQCLEGIGKHETKTKVIVFCDDEVKHLKLVEVLDACRQHQLTDINVMAR